MTNPTGSPFLSRTSTLKRKGGYVYTAAAFFDTFDDARDYATGQVFANVEDARGNVLALTDVTGTFHDMRPQFMR